MILIDAKDTCFATRSKGDGSGQKNTLFILDYIFGMAPSTVMQCGTELNSPPPPLKCLMKTLFLNFSEYGQCLFGITI
jgi:hypothetical protein